jgi:hypothetical protein
MGKVDTWSYWFKSKDGHDIINTTNKLDIPEGFQHVKLFKIHKSDGSINDVIYMNDKIVWTKKSINTLNPCDKFYASVDELKEIYKLLGVKYPAKDYNKILNQKQKQDPKLKKCKITNKLLYNIKSYISNRRGR